MKNVRIHLFGSVLAAAIASPVSAQSDAELAALIENATEEDQQEFCVGLRGVADEMNTQLPLQIDPATRLLNVRAFFLDSACHYSMTYEIHEGKLFKMLQAQISESVGDDVPMDFVENFYAAGGQGYVQFQETLRNNLMSDPQVAQLANIPFVDARAGYVVLGKYMDDFELQLGVTE